MIEDRHVDAGPTVGIDGLAKPVGVTPAAEVEAQFMPDSSGRPKGGKGETQLVDVAPAVETKGRHMNAVPALLPAIGIKARVGDTLPAVKIMSQPVNVLKAVEPDITIRAGSCKMRGTTAHLLQVGFSVIIGGNMFALESHLLKQPESKVPAVEIEGSGAHFRLSWAWPQRSRTSMRMRPQRPESTA